MAFHYHPDGDLKKEVKTIGGVQYTTEYGYNKNNVLTSITYPTGRTITYTPDEVEKTVIARWIPHLNGIPKNLATGPVKDLQKKTQE